MYQLISFTRSAVFSIITLPVNFLISLVTRKAQGPGIAVIFLGIILLLANLIIILPTALLSFRYHIAGIIGVNAVAQLNIITVQYVMLLPIGALAFQINTMIKKGFVINTDIAAFITVIAPIFGTITCSIAFWVISGTRLNIMEDIGYREGPLSIIQHINGAPDSSWGYFTDILRASFPFFNPGKNAFSIALNCYTAAALLYFSYGVWEAYHSGNEERIIDIHRLTWNPGSISLVKKIGTLTGAVFLAVIAGFCFVHALSGYIEQRKIFADGITVFAVPNGVFTDESGEYVKRNIRFTYTAAGRDITSVKNIEYRFYVFMENRKKPFLIRYHKDNPEINMILYSDIYSLTPEHDNDYSAFLRTGLFGLGFIFAALWLFPLTWFRGNN